MIVCTGECDVELIEVDSVSDSLAFLSNMASWVEHNKSYEHLKQVGYQENFPISFPLGRGGLRKEASRVPVLS